MQLRCTDSRLGSRLREKGRRLLISLVAWILVVGVTACSDDPETAASSPAARDQPPASVPEAVRKVTIAARDQLCESAVILEAQVLALAQNPTAQRLQKARTAWREAHEHWRVWQLIQWIADGATSLASPARIDAHPILPGYLDRIPGYPASGLVFSEVRLDGDALNRTHQSTDLYYGTLGFHPLEFMLWGMPDKNGAPSRRHDAFIDLPGSTPDTVPSTARRRALTASIAALLSMELTEICPPAATPPWLAGLAQQMADDEKLKQAVGWWLKRLAARLTTWEQNPDGEDRNGMPLWHSAFARSDFAELKAELDWLVKHHWPASGAAKTMAEPLGEALDSLAENRVLHPKEDPHLQRALEATIELDRRLAPSVRDAETQQDVREEGSDPASAADSVPGSSSAGAEES